MYDERVAVRIRRAIEGTAGITEKKMFGGIAFLKNGKMFCGIAKNDLMVRVGPDAHEDALAQPHARPMDFTGRPMKGYVFVAPEGFKTAAALGRWLTRATDFVSTLPRAKRRPKKKK